ncbi:hypothetical protein F442_02750 [Phytophthora nicotianae P10297]|uniref:HAT C-terminal dimerisation domain-containing protein n=1 Tax=Phytophthora nicotianae P10297 TaxID=1317064 RepID=W2ZZ56_PHYNI|nr:hypothetical protein F442_02750 [Phytophthora nicotianae P10297]
MYKRTERSIDRVVISSCRPHGKSGKEAVERKNAVNTKVRSKLLELLAMVIEPVDNTETAPVSSVARLSRVEAECASRPARLPTVTHRDRRAEEELDRWLEDPVGVERSSDSTPRESVLDFWQRLEHQGTYRIIPKAVKVLYSIPCSSCGIERDFGVSGNMVPLGSLLSSLLYLKLDIGHHHSEINTLATLSSETPGYDIGAAVAFLPLHPLSLPPSSSVSLSPQLSHCS